MSSANIQAKVKAGLANAAAATGSANAELVYLVSTTKSGGNTPLDPPVISESKVLLLNAIFTSYALNLVGGNIQAGDRKLICDNDVEISVGDIIEQGTTRYLVVDLGVTAPTSDVLVYFPQCRVQ